jgi:hypothetical protein
MRDQEIPDPCQDDNKGKGFLPAKCADVIIQFLDG